MVYSAQPEKKSLWRAGFALFARYWKEWLIWAAGFFVAMVLFQIAFYDPSFQAFMEKARAAQQAGQKLTPEESAQFFHMLWHVGLVSIPLVITVLLQAYAYVVFFMRRQAPVLGPPKLDAGRFFFWLWNSILYGLTGILVAIGLIGLPVGVLGATLGKAHPGFAPAIVLLAVAGAVGTVCILARFALVPTLAVGGIKPVFRTSWELTRGNCWRVIGNGILFAILIVLLWLVVALAERAVLEISYTAVPALFGTLPVSVTPATHPLLLRFFSPMTKLPYGMVGNYVNMVFASLNLCWLSGLARAFSVAMTQILYTERGGAAKAA